MVDTLQSRENPFEGKSVDFTFWSHDYSSSNAEGYSEDFFQQVVQGANLLPPFKMGVVILEDSSITDSQNKKFTSAVTRGSHPTEAYLDSVYNKTLPPGNFALRSQVLKSLPIMGDRTFEYALVAETIRSVKLGKLEFMFDARPDKDDVYDLKVQTLADLTKNLNQAVQSEGLDQAVEVFRQSRLALADITRIRDKRAVTNIKTQLSRGKVAKVFVLIGAAHVAQMKELEKEGISTTRHYVDVLPDGDLPLHISLTEKLVSDPNIIVDPLEWRKAFISFVLQRNTKKFDPQKLAEREKEIMNKYFSSNEDFDAIRDEVSARGPQALLEKIG